MTLQPLPHNAATIDRQLTILDKQVDWLYYLSPTHNDEHWACFRESQYTDVPPLTYPDIPRDYNDIKDALHQLSIDSVENPLLRALFFEKASELELQVDLVTLRDTDGFLPISTELFGNAEPTLLALAKSVMDKVPNTTEDTLDAGYLEVVDAAHAELDSYRQQVDNLTARVDVLDDLNSMIMVHDGHLKIAKSMRVPKARIQPLIAHEVGTHIVTRYNGQQQNLKLLEFGLAHYDPLQEGLGTMAEYLAGYLPPQRLRVIAARVIATDLASQRCSLKRIFEQLHDNYQLTPQDAFDTAVRALRGGGLTKDAVYLRGLNELLAYLQQGGDMQLLHLGKFAMSQYQIIEELLADNWIAPATLLPRHLTEDASLSRLHGLNEITIETLFQPEPQL